MTKRLLNKWRKSIGTQANTQNISSETQAPGSSGPGMSSRDPYSRGPAASLSSATSMPPIGSRVISVEPVLVKSTHPESNESFFFYMFRGETEDPQAEVLVNNIASQAIRHLPDIKNFDDESKQISIGVLDDNLKLQESTVSQEELCDTMKRSFGKYTGPELARYHPPYTINFMDTLTASQQNTGKMEQWWDERNPGMDPALLVEPVDLTFCPGRAVLKGKRVEKSALISYNHLIESAKAQSGQQH